MGITRAHNGADVTRGSLVVREPAEARAGRDLRHSAYRYYAQCADLALRFVIRGNRFASANPKPDLSLHAQKIPPPH